MLKYNFIYELKLLLRSRWIQVLSLTVLLLFGFSSFNGKQKADKRIADITLAKKEMQDNDARMLQILDSTERGLNVEIPRWLHPKYPMVVGNYYPRVAAMETQPMAFMATGQADMFTPYIEPTVRGDDYALNFTEMTSPVQLLFGSFDLAFVIVYLLPLLIIAFSYNVLSAEKESGSLRLLASQPIRIYGWVLQKLGLRFFWLSLLVVVSMTTVFVILGIDFKSQLSTYFSLIVLALAYMLFWFALAFLVNLWIGSSAKNAVSMLGLWVIFVLLVPSVLNQLGNALHPIPSRTLMINEMREKKTEVAKRQDEILDNFLRDHPEYAINDSTQTRNYWHRYMASQKLVKQELGPIVNSYESQLSKQQELVSDLKWFSPALMMQESLNKMAGSSTSDFEYFRKQVVAFADQWREHLMPFLYNNQEFTTGDYANLPSFKLERPTFNFSTTLTALLLISLGLIGLGFSVARSTSKLIHS